MISVALDNGCHAMLDEGKTEQVRNDFAPDATTMDFSVLLMQLNMINFFFLTFDIQNSTLVGQVFQ